jgi:hypothetical protein
MRPAIDIVERLLNQKNCAMEHIRFCSGAPRMQLFEIRQVDVNSMAKSSGRIDALVAMAMALSLALLRAARSIDVEAQSGELKSVYP